MPIQTQIIEKSEPPPIVNTETLAYIKRYRTFAVLPQSVQEQLASLLELEKHPADACVFRFNDPGDVMYFLCEGTVRFVTHDYTGTEVILEEIQSGDLFGEVAVYTGGERSADAVVTSTATLLLLRRERMNEFLRTCPEVSEYLLQRMANRLAYSNRMLRKANIRVEEAVAAERSVFDRIVKKIVDIFGTLPSFIIHILIFLLWIILKSVFDAGFMKFETDQFLILSLIINVEGFAVSMLILVNQARESKEEGVRDRTEFDATIRMDNSIRFLHEKMDEMTAELRRFHVEQSASNHNNHHNPTS